MKINCLSCGFKVDLDDVYDDYAGLVKCYSCGGLLEIKTEDGKIKSIKRMPRADLPSDEEAAPVARKELTKLKY